MHAGTKETFGLVILEAMACGRPVVAARAGAFPELIDDSVGMLAEPQDATSMAEAIAALYERDLDALGHAARARVLRQFTWQHSFQTQMATYAALAARQAPAAAAGADPAAALAEFLSAPRTAAQTSQRVISSTPPNSSTAPSTRTTLSGCCGKPSQPK